MSNHSKLEAPLAITKISVRRITARRLQALGAMGDSYERVIIRLIELAERSPDRLLGS